MVVACGETPFEPLGPPAVAPLSIEVSTTSCVSQVRLLVWPQLMLAALAVNAPILGGATTTCADAIPAVKRGSGPFLANSSPRFHGDLVTVPFLVTWITTFSLAPTVTEPLYSSLSSRITVTWCVPGGTTKF